MGKNRKRKKVGFARTKEIPHFRHPAYYEKTGNDDIKYVTFTHSEDIEIKGKLVKGKPLTSNIEAEERGKSISYVYPKSYKGKRSALGKDTDEFSLIKADKAIVKDILKNYPVEIVPYTSNSKNKKKKK